MEVGEKKKTNPWRTPKGKKNYWIAKNVTPLTNPSFKARTSKNVISVITEQHFYTEEESVDSNLSPETSDYAILKDENSCIIMNK